MGWDNINNVMSIKPDKGRKLKLNIYSRIFYNVNYLIDWMLGMDCSRQFLCISSLPGGQQVQHDGSLSSATSYWRMPVSSRQVYGSVDLVEETNCRSVGIHAILRIGEYNFFVGQP